MTPAELNYNIYNKELLAIVAVFKKIENLYRGRFKNYRIYRL